MLRSTRLLRATRLATPSRVAVSARSLSVSSAPHQHQVSSRSSNASAYHPFPVLPTLVDPTSEEYADRARQMQDKEDELRKKWGKVLAGGGERAQKKAKDAGKLLVRERWVAWSLSVVGSGRAELFGLTIPGFRSSHRIDALLDPFSPFLELSALAAEGMYDGKVPAAGIVTGIGRVNGVECMIVANDVRSQAFLHALSSLVRSFVLRRKELMCHYVVVMHRPPSRADRTTRSRSRNTSARRKSQRRTNSRASTSVSPLHRVRNMGQLRALHEESRLLHVMHSRIRADDLPELSQSNPAAPLCPSRPTSSRTATTLAASFTTWLA